MPKKPVRSLSFADPVKCFCLRRVTVLANVRKLRTAYWGMSLKFIKRISMRVVIVENNAH